MTSSCSTCGRLATLRCGACFKHQLAVSWYCSKECQKSHWKKHKVHCKHAQVYTRVRHLVVPDNRFSDEAREVTATARGLGLSAGQAQTILEYLVLVPPSARPELFGIGEPTLKDDVLHAIDRVKLFKREEYKSGYETRVPEILRNKYENRETRHEVPFDCRPFREVDVEGGGRSGGIEILPADHEEFDFYTFTKTYANVDGTVFDPFLCRAGCNHRNHRVSPKLLMGRTFENAEDYDL